MTQEILEVPVDYKNESIINDFLEKISGNPTLPLLFLKTSLKFALKDNNFSDEFIFHDIDDVYRLKESLDSIPDCEGKLITLEALNTIVNNK